MGGANTKSQFAELRPRATLFYASFHEDTTWQAFADAQIDGVTLHLVDVAKHPDVALAEGVDDFPTLVCVNAVGVVTVFRPPDDLPAEYGRWVATVC